MKTLELNEGITWVGALDPNLRIFDIIMETEFGTTYNSYIVQGSEKIALFETVKIKFFDQYIEKLRTLIDISKIEYIVVNHTEPDHVGSVENMLALNPNIKIVGSKTAIKFLEGIVNRDFQRIVVNTGDTIDLGGKTLEFIMAPFLHWPDSMYTYIPEDKALVTCDSFGAHYSFEGILLSKISDKTDYKKALAYYFNMIMGPFKSHVLSAINKIKDKDIDIILPGHGPVLDEKPLEIVEIYKEWATEVSIYSKKTILIPYVSAYGYTEAMAKAIERGIRTEAVDVEVIDMVYANKNEVLKKIRWADGLLFGCSTINGDALPPIWNLLMEMSPVIHGKKLAAAFGSYGWSGEAVPNLESRFKMLRLKKFEDGLKINFKPSEDELDLAFNYGKRFAQALLGKSKPADIKAKTVNTLKPVIEGDGEIKKWICVVCGDVFEGEVPPEICPTCGASQDQFDEFFDEGELFVSEGALKILIIGNGVAGYNAAKAARQRNKHADIIIISDEKELTYNRPMLSDYLAGDYDQDKFYLETIEWYEENKIHQLLSTRVSKIDPVKKEVLTENNEVYDYDKLILANGSRNFIPPITDIKKQGVYTIRDLDDVNQILKQTQTAKNIVVIGGGLLGLEAAEAFLKFEKNITVLEVTDMIVKAQLDPESSNYLRKRIESYGLTIITEARITAILGDENVSGVQLETGEVVACDIVLVSAGIRSNIDICDGTDIQVNRGILVNDKMETTIKDIYAVGDVAEYDNKVYGIWPASSSQGEIAGANAVGDDKKFSHFTPSVVFNAFDVEIFSIGDTCCLKEKKHSTLVFDDLKNGNYEKIVFYDDVLVGGILIGNMSKTTKLIKGIKQEALKDEIIKELFQ